ncbi:hypothetical protein ABZP36_022116 [Zizania latifolia]
MQSKYRVGNSRSDHTAGTDRSPLPSITTTAPLHRSLAASRAAAAAAAVAVAVARRIRCRAELHGRQVVPEDHRRPRPAPGLPPHHPQGPICSLEAYFRRIPITDGRLNMGTWQGIWLCEHRDNASARKIVITLNGI